MTTDNYTDVFGSSTLPPSEYKYQALSLTADTTTYWPYNYTGTGSILGKINVLSSTGVYYLTMPDARQVSTGEDVLFINISSYTITVLTATGDVVASVTSGSSKYAYLKDNSTEGGTWGAFTYGTGTSAADASALAGNGLKATSATLSGNMPISASATRQTATATTRAYSYVFTGGSAAMTFPGAVTATSGWYITVKNAGTGIVTLTPVGGDLIDGVATLALNPEESCIVVTDGAAWYTVGLGRSTVYQFTKLVKSLAGLSAYTMTSADASNKLIQFTGAPSGAVTVTVPAVVAIYYVEVSTSNAYTVTMKTAAGAGVTMAQSTNTILYCDGVDVVSAQTSAIPATTITVTNDNSTNGTYYPAWFAASTGAIAPYVSSTKMTFNPSTGVFTCTGFSGALTGDVTGNVSGYATALKSATTTVAVSAATAPSNGQVLTATSSTTATWQTPSVASYPITPDIGGTGVANNVACTVTSSGSYGYTRTLTGTTNVTFPTTGTLATAGTAIALSMVFGG